MKKTRKRKNYDEFKLQSKEEDLNGIYYFSEPVKIEELKKENKVITNVYAKGNYCYALEVGDDTPSNQLYSWGFGENYVLGNRESDN